MESNQQSSRRAARLQRVELAIARADAKRIADGLARSRPAVGCRRRRRQLVPSGSPRACGSKDPRTRVSSPPEAGMKKPFRRRARKGSVVTHRCCEALASVLTLRAGRQIQRSPKGSPGMAVAVRVREPRRVAGQFNWLHRFHHHAFIRRWRCRRVSIPLITVLQTAAFPFRHCTLAEVEGLEPPWTRFWRPPLSPLSYTSSAHLRTKKPPRSIPGGLPIWGLSSVVSRHRQAHLAAREGTEHRAAQPILAAVFGKRWLVRHDHHGAELLRALVREVNRNQRQQ